VRARASLCWLASLCACAGAPRPAAPPAAEGGSAWIPLLAGEGLGSWRVTAFGGEGEVRARDGALECDFGSPLTGVTWTGAFPRAGYELALTAEKLSGNDFFCGLTFPVGAEHLTLVLGGWGGAVVGLSCVDGQDAARNATRLVRGFERGRPYRVRVRVDDGAVEAFLDGERIVALERAGHSLSLRPEVLPCRPLGIACFATRARWSELTWRPLPEGPRGVPAAQARGSRSTE